MATSWGWIHDALSPRAIELWLETDWDAGACRTHWLPTSAWMNEGWGEPPQFAARDSIDELRIAAYLRGLPSSSEPLELAARIHWHDVGGDDSRIGRRSPCAELAKQVCASCRIIEDCHQYALAAYEPGLWGGTTERQRREERSQRRNRHHRSG
jgi:WhiB family redox-sensing transcriptional regulator